MRILENSEEHLSEFIRLNEAWIQKYFELEQIDFEFAKNPKQIIHRGDYIFTLVTDTKESARIPYGTVVGVCALFQAYDGAIKIEGQYELVRMAVDEAYQGFGFASILLNTCFEKLKELKANKITLASNTKLIPAVSLYKKHGFVTYHEGVSNNYKRANVFMEKDVTDYVVS